jgi:hypothetical protein
VAKFPHTVSAHDDLDDVVMDWLFLVLRYAISREARDRLAVVDLAGKMDMLGEERDREAFRFFRNHSARLCTAIAAPDTPGRRQMLMAHARRIGQPRLRQVFLRTCHLESREKALPESGRTNSRSELWKGLQRR